MIFQNFGFNRQIIKAAGSSAYNYVSGAKVIYDFGNPASYSGTGTTVNDVSGNGLNGTLVNSPTFSSINGGYLQLNRASSQYIEYSSYFPSEFTVQLILKYDATDRAGDYPRYFSTNANNGVSIGYDVGWTTNGVFGSVFHGSSGNSENIELDGKSTIPYENTWASLTHTGTGGVGGAYNWQLITDNDYTNIITTPGGSYNRTLYTPSNQAIRIGYDYQANIYNTYKIMGYLVYDRVLSQSEITQNYNIFSARFIDSDAQSFINATGVSGSTALAIGNLVSDLKSYNLWNKMDAVYPLVGGTSTSTSYNLINTSTYQISWNGGVSFSTNGVTGDGTTGYGLTGINPTTAGTYGSGAHLSQYTRTAGKAGVYDMGGNLYPVTNPSAEWMIARFTNDRYCAFGNVVPGSPYVIASTTDYLGFFIGSANGTSTLYRNGSSLASLTNTYTIANFNIPILGASNGNGMNDFSDRQYAFFSIGKYLDSTDAANFNKSVTTFQTLLGRNV